MSIIPAWVYYMDEFKEIAKTSETAAILFARKHGIPDHVGKNFVSYS